MKKSFVFRSAAITAFCLASLAIKSESNVGSVKCTAIAENCPMQRAAAAARTETPATYPFESFLIKI